MGDELRKKRALIEGPLLPASSMSALLNFLLCTFLVSFCLRYTSCFQIPWFNSCLLFVSATDHLSCSLFFFFSSLQFYCVSCQFEIVQNIGPIRNKFISSS